MSDHLLKNQSGGTPSKRPKHFLTDVFVYGLTGVLAKSLSFLLVPLYTYHLSTAEFGILDFVNQIGQVVSMLLLINGLAMATMTFVLRASNRRDRENAVCSLVLLIFAAVIIGIVLTGLAALLLPIKTDTQYSTSLVVLAGCTITLEMTTTIPYVLMQSRLESQRYLYWNIGTLIIRLVLTIVAVVVLEWGISGILAVRAVTSGVPGLFLLAREIKIHNFMFNKSKLIEIAWFCLPLVPVSALGFLRRGGQRFFLLGFCGASELGVYALGAALVGAASTLAVVPIHKVWTVKMYEVFKQENASAKIGSFATQFVAFHIFVSLPLMLFGLEIVEILSPHAYSAAALVLVPLVIVSILETFSNIPDQVFFVERKSHLKLVEACVSAVISLAAYFFLIPTFGILGAAWGAVIVSAIRTIVITALSRLLFQIEYEKRKLFGLIVLTSLAVGVGALMPGNARGFASKVLLILLWLLVVYSFEIIPKRQFANVASYVLQKIPKKTKGIDI